MMGTTSGHVLKISNHRTSRYLRLTQRLGRYGDVVQVLQDDIAGSNDFECVTNSLEEKVEFSVLSDHDELLKTKKLEVDVVGNYPLQTNEMELPILRSGDYDYKNNVVPVWWFFDGVKSWKVGELSREQRNMPIHEVWPVEVFIELLEKGKDRLLVNYHYFDN